MTVVAACRVPQVGCVVMSDSRVTSSSGIIHSDRCRKVARAGSLTIGLFGSDAGFLLDFHRARVTGIPELVDMIREHDSTRTWGLLGYDSRADVLFGVDSDGEVMTYPEDRACAGAGQDLAHGALELLPLPSNLPDAVSVLEVAIGVACKRNAFCGGRRQWFATKVLT